MTIALLGELNSKLSWYAARASGLIAWSVVTLSILWGLALSTRLIRRRGVPAWLLDLHKFLGTLSLVFVGVHVLALWADTFVYFGPRELFVPFASAWRPGAVAWGIAATYLLVAIQITSWTMKRLPRKVWHSVHVTSIAMFVFATVHGFTSGADNTNLAVQWLALTGGLLVFLLVTFRVLAPRRARATARVRAGTSNPMTVT
jgi:predicted ferric reductase